MELQFMMLLLNKLLLMRPLLVKSLFIVVLRTTPLHGAVYAHVLKAVRSFLVAREYISPLPSRLFGIELEVCQNLKKRFVGASCGFTIRF